MGHLINKPKHFLKQESNFTTIRNCVATVIHLPLLFPNYVQYNLVNLYQENNGKYGKLGATGSNVKLAVKHVVEGKTGEGKMLLVA